MEPVLGIKARLWNRCRILWVVESIPWPETGLWNLFCRSKWGCEDFLSGFESYSVVYKGLRFLHRGLNRVVDLWQEKKKVVEPIS